jgi:CHAT domain-containing protein
MSLSEKLGDKDGIAQARQDIGILELRQEHYKEALALYQKSLSLFEETGSKANVAVTLDLIGEVQLKQRRYIDAMETFQRALAMARSLGVQQDVATIYTHIAQTYYEQGKFEQVLDFAQRASAYGRTARHLNDLWESRMLEGLAYEGLHQPLEARAALDEAIEDVEELRNEVAGGEESLPGLFESTVDPYRHMVELRIAQSQIPEALSCAERAKGRTLLDLLKSGRVNVTKAMTAVEREREEELQALLASLNRQIEIEEASSKSNESHISELKSDLEKARLQYSEFRTNLYAAHPELRAQRGQIQVLSLSDAANLLPDVGSALLEYVVTEKKAYLFAITKETGQSAPELKVYPLEIKQEELVHKAEYFRQKLAQRDLNVRALARQLYDLLLKPAEKQLAGKNALLIVPDGPLWNLPFQALRDGNRYLLEKYAIAYSPSLTVLREMMNLHEKNRQTVATVQSATLLAMADPSLGRENLAHAAIVYRGEKLGPLPEARHEVEVLKQLYGAPQSEVYTGAEAREDRFKVEAGKFRILHLATHGILDNASPMYSNVVLSPGDSGKEDGLLEAREIMQMDLKADLAVLSACETARGHISAGEGVIGLSWAFFVAGTSTTVVSQWKVASASTAGLMLAFHRALMTAHKDGDDAFSTARALQHAEIGLLRNPRYAHPFYWAGFIVVGDPN